MPRVKLWKAEVKRNLLPPVCIVCGADADRTQRVKFTWVPSWVIVLILAGVLIWAIVSIILRKAMAVDAPVCGRHARHWFWRKAIPLGGLLGCLAGLAAGIAALSDPRFEAAGGYILLATGVFFLLVLVVAAVLASTGVRPTEITDRTITLAGVHRDFVDALEDDRARDEEEEEREYQERRAKRALREGPGNSG